MTNDQELEMITDIAKVAHETNRAFCETLNDFSCTAWDESSDHIQNSTIEGVYKVISNLNVTPEEMHKEWMDSELKDGWVYGDEKDQENKTHPCLVEYNDLPIQQKFKDHLFINIVKTYIDFFK